MFDRLRQRLFGGWSRFVSHRPWLILLIAGLVAAAAIAVTVRGLGFNPNRNDLISEELDWNQRFINWVEHFPGNADLAVVIDTYNRDGQPDEPTAAAARRLVDELGPKCAALPSVVGALWGFETEQVSPKALRLQPMPQFQHDLARIADSEALLNSPTPQALFAGAGQEMLGGGADMDETDAETGLVLFTALIDAFTRRLQTPADQPVDFTHAVERAMGIDPWQYLLTPNGRMLVIRITPKPDPNALSPYEKTIASVRGLLEESRAQYPHLEFGLTGIEVVEADETTAATVDSTKASILAAALIALLLVIACHGFKTPIMLLLSLALGVAWTFGFLTLTIGHLQVISVVFTVILLGLGVAFGIHIITRFEMVRHNYADDEAGFAGTLRDTFETMGPGIITGAVTTAAAFCTTMLTDFEGVAEMGQIAAGGVLLCLIAMFSVFPALLRLLKWRRAQVRPVENRYVHFFEERWVSPFVRHPKVTLIGAAVLMALSLAAITQMRFDYNLMELLPAEVPSVRWAERLDRDGGESIYFGVSIVDDMDQAREQAEQFLALPTVKELGGVGLLIPDDEKQKLAMLATVRDRLGSQIERVIAHPDADAPPDQNLVAQLGAMRAMVQLFMTRAPEPLRVDLAYLTAAIQRFLTEAQSLSPDVLQRRLAALQTDFTNWRLATAKQMRQALDPTPLDLGDMPHAVMAPYTATIDGQTRYELSIYPRVPAGADLLQFDFLRRFITEMRGVDPNVTGVIVQIYESGTLIWQSYLKAGAYALIAVFVLVWIDFRRIADAGLSLVPVAVGFAVTFGIMWLVGMQINPANIIVLPLMFGIGVDAGVHILHRYRMDSATRPLGLTAGTGKAISLTSYTTIIGFASLMIARHRGIQGLGFVMAVGIAMTLLACWIVMPAWLELRAKRRAPSPPNADFARK